MKILLIDVSCKIGSTGKIVYDLYTEYKRKGHDVKICYGRGRGFRNPDIYKISSSAGVYLHALKTRLTGYVGRGNYLATMRLIKFINKFRPDIVHVHNIHGYYVHAYKLLLHLKEHNVRTVFTMHDEWSFTGKCGHPYECERLKDGCGNCPQLHEYPKSCFFDRTSIEYRKKKEIFTGFKTLIISPVSYWLKDQAKKSPFLKDHHFSVVYNGLNTDVFTPTEHQHLKIKWNIKKDEKIILHVTPNFDDARKGGKYVFELAKRLSNKNIRVIIVGVKNKIDHFFDNLILVGQTENQNELAAYYSMADITLLTSQKETFSMICAESLCCGTPVVGFASGAPAEVAPEPFGLFVPYGDMEALEQSVHKLINGNVKLSIHKQCEFFGKDNYGKNVMAEKYIELYARKD